MFHSDAIGPFWHLLDGHFELFRNDRQGVCHVVVRVARQWVHHRRLDVVVVAWQSMSLSLGACVGGG